MTLIDLKPAASAPRADFVAALNRAYADYYVPIHLHESSFEELVQREDIKLESSIAAHDNGAIVGLGMLGVRGARGWIGGMGVVPERRGQGVGRQMLNALISEARRLGLARLQLEVIIQNEPAYQLYQSVGFKRLRHLAVLFTGDAPRAINGRAPDGITIHDADPAVIVALLPGLAATVPPWQHDPESMRVIMGRLRGLIAQRVDGSAAGAVLFVGENDQGAVLALAARSDKVGAALLAEVRRRLPLARLNFLNVPDDDSMLPALLGAGFSEAVGQHEMILELV